MIICLVAAALTFVTAAPGTRGRLLFPWRWPKTNPAPF